MSANKANRVRFTPKSVMRKPPKVGHVVLWDTIQPGLGLRINAGGRRSYFCMPRVNGSQEKTSLGTVDQIDIAEARDKFRDVMREAARGIGKKKRKEIEGQERIKAERANGNTFRTISELYFASEGKYGGKKLRSRHELEQRLEREVHPEWGSRPVGEITRDDVEDLIARVAEDRPIASNRLLADLRRIFQWANMGANRRLYGVEVPPTLGVIPLGVEKSRARVLEDSELARILAAVNKMGSPFGPLLKLLILTGQRRGEVGGMKRDELKKDIGGDYWLIPGERTKNGLPHIVPIAPQAIAALESVPKIEECEHVFMSARPGRVNKEIDRPVSGWGKVKERLDKTIAEDAAKAAKEPLDMEKHSLAHWTLHDFRRTMVTRMNENLGIEPHVVEAVVNHISGAAKRGVAGTYNKAQYLVQRRLALEAWANHVEALTPGKSKAPGNVVKLRKGA